jgi:hypothetical protein
MSIQITEITPTNLLLDLNSSDAIDIYGGVGLDTVPSANFNPIPQTAIDQINIAQQIGLVNIAIQQNLKINASPVINVNLDGLNRRRRSI